MTDPNDYNERMSELLTKLGIPTERVRANPTYEVHPGGITLSPQFFVAFDEITEEQRAALYDLTGLEKLR